MLRSILLTAAVGSSFLAFGQSANAVTVYGLTTDNNLFSFDSSTPGTVASGTYVTGLQQNEVLLGIDFRPATNTLYAVGSSSRVYTLDLTSGAATAVGGVFTPAVSGTSFDIDFNPTVDRIRLISDADQNLRLTPAGAVAAVDGAISYGTAINPNVVGAAYTNNFAGATSTVLYTIDSGTDTLNIQNPPNNGTQVVVGSLGVDTSSLVGFDISTVGGTDTAFASLTRAGTSGSVFSTINLATGVASTGTLIGGGIAVRDIAVLTPEPTTLSLFGLTAIGALARRRRA